MASLLARWPKPAQRTRAPSPSPRPRPCATAGHTVPPWRAGRALPPRGVPGAPGRAHFSLLFHSPSSTPPLSLSLARTAAAAAPPLTIVADARNSPPWQLRPPPSNPRPPATLPRLPPPHAHAQPPSVSLACPLELAGVSWSSGDLSAHVVLPLLTTIAHNFKRIRSALTSHTFRDPWFAFYRTEMAGPR